MVVTRSSTLTLGGGIAIGYKGVLDCSTSPNYPSAAAGDMYLVSVAGKIGGASGTVVAVGDAIVANTTNAGGTEAAVGAYWDILEANVDWSAVAVTGGTINGATIGATSPSTIVGTTITANTGVVPDANDGAYLGTSTVSFSDLFLAEGGVINWDNGDVTLTQTGNELAVAGGTFKATSPEFTTDITTPVVQTAGNAASFYTNIPVTGTDATLHTSSHMIDGNSYLYATATGDGVGGVGVNTIGLGVTGNADVIHIGDANALVDITDAHWSITEPGVLSIVSMGANWTNAGQTVADLGTITTCDINGGSIDGVTIGAAAAPTVTNLGSVTTCDINGGTIDGTTIGGNTPAAGTFTNISVSGGRYLGTQGVDVASAADITLGNGNYFDITGTTETQRILGTGWTAGSIVTLQFDASVTVKHNTAAGSSYFGLQLAAGADFNATAGDVLMLVFDGAWWREVSRTVI